jgi:hypothetical protein
MQTSPESGGLLHTVKTALRGWLIKIGLQPPPDVLEFKEKGPTEEQQQAQVDLRFHQQRRPKIW